MKNTINFKNKLYLGDNIDILQELYEQNGEFVDMIFADPPYFLSNDGDIVLDPFLGSGTTAVSCVLNNRKYIGIEKEKEYFELAKKRVEDVEIKVKNGFFDY